MAGVRKVWNGGALSADLKAALSHAGRATVADAAAQAQQPGYAPRDTGLMASNITFVQEDDTTFWFGNVTEAYTLKQETDPTLHHDNGGAFFLRRSADKIFPTFEGRLAEALRGHGK